MDDGAAAPQEDFTSLPVSERLTHKNWKARVSGYETLSQTFAKTASEEDPAFKPYINNPDLLKKIVTDSNVVAQEKGVECVVALVKFAGESAAKTRDTVVPALVDKCFGSTRAGTKAQAIELVLQYTEMENTGTGVVSDIIPGLGAKQPKAVAGCVAALKEIIRLFGTQTTPPVPILKIIPKIFAHSDKTVRAEGTHLVQHIYQYMGAGIEQWLADLKPVQVKELKEGFEAMEAEGRGKGTLKPERLTRAHAREVAIQGENNGDAADASEEPEEPENFDPADFAEPVNISSQLPKNWQGNLASSKWKERKEALDDLLTAISSAPRLQEIPEFSDLAKAFALRIQSDANVNCVMTAAACQEALAKGLKGGFAKYREMVVSPMLERLKERKANVTDAIGGALDAIFAATTLSDILPDLGPALGSKNPQVKEGTLKFLARCLSSATSPIPATQIKLTSEILAGLLEDGYEGARNEAAVCLGTMMKMVGERPLNPIMDGLADVRKAKITEAFEKANVKCKAGAAPARAAAPPAKQAPPKAAAKAPSKAASKAPAPKVASSPPPEDPTPPPASKPAAKPPARLAQKAPPAAATKKPTPAQPAKPSKSAAPPAPGGLDSFKFKHTPEDAEALAADLIPASIVAGFADSAWKTRLAALDETTEWLEGVSYDVDAEVVVRAFAKKGWSDKNFQVSAKLYAILQQLSERCPSFGRGSVALCVGHLSEKLGDLKLKKPAGDTLLAFAEKTSLQFVLNQGYDPLSKQKAPKVLADAITWISSALTDFGIAGLSLRSLIDFLKIGLANSNAAVRTSATKTLVTVKLFAGSGIKDLLEDLNPQLLNTITTEFDKVEGTAAPEPTRTCNDVTATSTSVSGGGQAAGGGDALDDLFPRVELDSLLKGTTILADAKSDAWKVKKEALEQLQATLDQGSNKRLKSNMGDIAQVLKARVTDTNKAVQSLALDIVARIAIGMGKPFEKHTRHFVHPIATVLSDQKAPVRASALQTLTAIADSCESLDTMISGITTALDTTNPMQKGQLLGWIFEWTKAHESSSSSDASAWVPAVVSSLDDRNGDVRKSAQAILPFIISSAGYDYVLQQTNSLKPASRASAVPLIQAARGSAAPPPPLAEPVAKPTTKSALKAAPPETPPPSSPVTAQAPAVPLPATGSKLTGIRRKLPQGTSRPETPVEAAPSSRILKTPGKKPGSSLPAAAEPTLPGTIFSSVNADARKTRIGKDAARWVNEGGPARKDLVEVMHSQMELCASKDVVTRLFSHDHNAVSDYISGLTLIQEFYISATEAGDDHTTALALANFDFPLRYASLKVHESQPNLVSKCLDVIEAVIGLWRAASYQLADYEALCFIPTVIHKLGDAREQVRTRVQAIIQSLPTVYPYSRVFALLLEHGLKSKVAKTRQGSLDELGGILKKSGIGACEPSKAFPVIASTLSDKDSQVRKSALAVLSESYVLVGDRIWKLVGQLTPKDKTQLEERLRRVPGPSSDSSEPLPVAQVARLTAGLSRPASPGISRIAGIPRPASPSVMGGSRIARPASPAAPPRAVSPGLSVPAPNHRPASPSHLPAPSGISRPRSLMPSRLARPPKSNFTQPPVTPTLAEDPVVVEPNLAPPPRNHQRISPPPEEAPEPPANDDADSDNITITISTILSSDSSRSVDALKKIQKILTVGQEAGASSPQYRELAEHTEGLIETITLQLAHIFERPEDLLPDENFRLAKHLIQTLNTFCDHAFLAESLTVDILTSLLEELTLRLLETDDSTVKKVKDLSRFINMILLRLFNTARKMSIFRALFNLLGTIVKPFPSQGTQANSKESKVAELVLKCIWKLVRTIPQDLTEQKLDPVELFPVLEHFLQNVPPNEWRARATNKVPCGDMPLRTVKVIIQHVVAHYADDVYDLLSASFDDPSATIVYPYVYRILNSATAPKAPQDLPSAASTDRHHSPTSSRGVSPPPSSHHPASSHRSSPSTSSMNGNGRMVDTSEPDPDAQLLTIIGHISSETTGALHKEGITELHHFLKAHPHKKPRVEKMLESTGPAFRKYINRALATRAAEDQERDVAVADTLSKLVSNERTPEQQPTTPTDSDAKSPPQSPRSPRKAVPDDAEAQNRLSRLHNLFQYRSSTQSDSSHGRATPRTSLS